ncbi:hypothetical protein ACFRAM_13600 [Paenibacillus sp. NPDC056722]|uniref:hypothetical protein n=1 Tax=Paenibacillus sp. NPDC056722 TaxID=3345924 RepID=UPI0036A43C2C
MLEYIGEEEDYSTVIINGEEFAIEDEYKFIIPKSIVTGVRLDELHPLYKMEICEKIQENTIYIETVPYTITREFSGNMAVVEFEDSGRRKFWDGPVGFKLYMETKRDLIIERQKELSDIVFDDYEDDGDYIFLRYSTRIEAELLETVIQQAEQIVKEIEGAADLTLNSPFKEVHRAKNEADFTISILIPLIRKLGFSNVRYNHGKKEYGKDVIFTRRTEFDEYEYWGVQVKYGDISGGVRSNIDELIGQAIDAYRMPFYDVYTRSKQRIS